MISKSKYFSIHSCLALLLLTAASSCIFNSSAKDLDEEEKFTVMSFSRVKHNFGQLTLGESASTVFKFRNTGSNALLIKDVTTSCGCTVPEWPKGIIKPGAGGAIKIVYDGSYPGMFNKTILIVYNGRNSPHKLEIEGSIPFPQKRKKDSTAKKDNKKF